MLKEDTQTVEERKWFLQSVEGLQEKLAKELRLHIVVLDDKGNPVTESSQQSTIFRLVRKSPKGKELYNQSFSQAADLITAHSDAVLIKVFDGLASFWAPVATAKGRIIGSVVGGGGPFTAGKVDPEEFEEKISDFYKDSGLESAGTSEEDLLNAVKGTPVFLPEVVKRKISEFGRTIGILAEETPLGTLFNLSSTPAPKAKA